MIPKIIHQIWIGEKKIPKHIKEWMDEVRDKHPDFEYYFWTDDNLPEMPEKLLDIYKNIADPTKTSAKSDLLRAYVVLKYGGMYLDADFKVINGFHGSSIDFDNIDGVISINDSYGTEALGCNFFGFCKDHKILNLLIDGVEDSHQWLGPNYWSMTLFKHFGYNGKVSTEQLQSDLDKYKTTLLNTRELESLYFQHIALASWYPNSEWNNKLKSEDYE